MTAAEVIADTSSNDNTFCLWGNNIFSLFRFIIIKQIFLQAKYYHSYPAKELGKIPVCYLEFNSPNSL
jgi:hypothetical protein